MSTLRCVQSEPIPVRLHRTNPASRRRGRFQRSQCIDIHIGCPEMLILFTGRRLLPMPEGRGFRRDSSDDRRRRSLGRDPAAPREATLAATSRGAVDKAGVAAPAAVARGPAMAAGLKAGAVVLAVVSLISAGAGLVALAGRDIGPPSPPGSPQGEPAARAGAPAADRYGDPLPKGAIARLGTTRFRHGDGFPRVFFAPDGKTLVTARGEARVWDARQRDGSSGRSTPAGWWYPRRTATHCSRPGTGSFGRSMA